jgi:hypothetical protein
MALPHELAGPGNTLSPAMVETCREHAQWLRSTYGVAVEFAIHEPPAVTDRRVGRTNRPDRDPRAWHAHFTWTTRVVDDLGRFGAKTRKLDNARTASVEITRIRAAGADAVNRALKGAGLSVRVDPRSLAAQGIDREPTVKEGAAARAIEARAPGTSERVAVNRAIRDRNAEVAALEDMTEYHDREHRAARARLNQERRRTTESTRGTAIRRAFDFTPTPADHTSQEPVPTTAAAAALAQYEAFSRFRADPRRAPRPRFADRRVALAQLSMYERAALAAHRAAHPDHAAMLADLKADLARLGAQFAPRESALDRATQRPSQSGGRGASPS